MRERVARESKENRMKYSAEDFAKAKFAEHEDGRLAVRWRSESDKPWEVFGWGFQAFGTDEGCAQNGWVPVRATGGESE